MAWLANWKYWNTFEIFLFCSFSADSSEQVLATTESDMPADSEPILVEVIIIRISSLRRITDTMILSNDDDNVRETIEIQKNVFSSLLWKMEARRCPEQRSGNL